MRAAGLMRADPGVMLAAVAMAVGYDSESAFGKAFRRIMGVPPGSYRRSQSGSPV